MHIRLRLSLHCVGSDRRLYLDVWWWVHSVCGLHGGVCRGCVRVCLRLCVGWCMGRGGWWWRVCRCLVSWWGGCEACEELSKRVFGLVECFELLRMTHTDIHTYTHSTHTHNYQDTASHVRARYTQHACTAVCLHHQLACLAAKYALPGRRCGIVGCQHMYPVTSPPPRSSACTLTLTLCRTQAGSFCRYSGLLKRTSIRRIAPKSSL